MADLKEMRRRLAFLQANRQRASTADPVPTNIVVNITMPDMVAALAERFSDGHGGLRTSGRFGPSPG